MPYFIVITEYSTSKKIQSNFFQRLPQLPRTLQADPVECNEMYFFIQQNRRLTTSLSTLRHSKIVECPSQVLTEEKYISWRTLAADLRLFPNVRQIPPSFNRDIRHLDHIYSREVHKVAVIYVAKGQEVSLVPQNFHVSHIFCVGHFLHLKHILSTNSNGILFCFEYELRI